MTADSVTIFSDTPESLAEVVKSYEALGYKLDPKYAENRKAGDGVVMTKPEAA